LGEFRFDSVNGGYFFTPPDFPFQIEPPKNQPWEYYDINFLPHDPFLCEHLKAPLPPRPIDPTTKIMLDYIVENWHREDSAVRQNCNDFLNTLLLLLFADQTQTEVSGSQFILTNGYSKATLSALNYIEQHYYSHFSLDELAQATSYNKSYLCAAFSENTGVSIVTYTNFLRIRKAIGSILYFPRPFNRVASALGFDNPNYFSRTFHTFTGLSPRDFNLVARRMTAEEKANLYASEPLLNYRRYPLEEALRSMRHIGELFKAQSAQAE
jgi:AraC-like DNA-binding protein